MIILQKSQAYRTTTCLFSRVMLNIDQEEKLQTNQPSHVNLLPVNWMVRYDFGAADHQEPPKKPLVQKNMCAKGREPMSMILGKLVSSMSMYVKYRI